MRKLKGPKETKLWHPSRTAARHMTGRRSSVVSRVVTCSLKLKRSVAVAHTFIYLLTVLLGKLTGSRGKLVTSFLF